MVEKRYWRPRKKIGRQRFMRQRMPPECPFQECFLDPPRFKAFFGNQGTRPRVLRHLQIMRHKKKIIIEIVRTVVGSIGIILAVPITTLLASWAFGKKK